MSEKTSIEWCDYTWSPWRGCTKVSAGCAHCYAETLSRRNPAVLGKWGKGKPRVLAKNWTEPARWNRNAKRDLRCLVCGATRLEDAVNCDGYCAQCELDAHPYRPRVFPSLCDWLDEEVPIEWLSRFLALIHDTPHLDWLLLTKRPENWLKRIEEVKRYALRKPNPPRTHEDAAAASWAIHWLEGDYPHNVWVGTSVEDQPNADRRIPELLKIPARVRFLSVEPMLGPVDMFAPSVEWFYDGWMGNGRSSKKPGINWVIVGGESGHGARPCNVDWIRDLVKQCKGAGVPCFVKQLGSQPFDPSRATNIPSRKIQSSEELTDLDAELFDQMCAAMVLPTQHPKGGDPSEWPEDLRVRRFPEVKL